MYTCRRPPKKQQINGFALFRRQISGELRRRGERVSEEELTELTALRWDELDDDVREEWKNQAKEEKMRSRTRAFASYEFRFSDFHKDKDKTGSAGGSPIAEEYSWDNMASASSSANRNPPAARTSPIVPTNVSTTNQEAAATAGDQAQQEVTDTGAAQEASGGGLEPFGGGGGGSGATVDDEPEPSGSIRKPHSSSLVSQQHGSFGFSGERAGGGPPSTTSSVKSKSAAPRDVLNPFPFRPRSPLKFTGGRSRADYPRTKAERRTAREASVLQAMEDWELSQNPEKRRTACRRYFLTTFTWKYVDKKSVVLDKKFYYLTAQPLHYAPDGRCVPAEISCVGFTLASGITDYFCTPILPMLPFEDMDQPQLDDLKRRTAQTHGFSLPMLKELGRDAHQVVAKFIDMSHSRELNCRNIRFFSLQNEITTVYSCLISLLQNSDVDDKYKDMPVNDMACLDDLAHAFFHFFNVDSGIQPGLHNPINLSSIYETIEGSKFTSYQCESHNLLNRYTQTTTNQQNEPTVESGGATCAAATGTGGGICCLSKQRLIVEIIKSSVDRGKVDEAYLRQFAALNRELDSDEMLLSGDQLMGDVTPDERSPVVETIDDRDTVAAKPAEPPPAFSVVIPLMLPADQNRAAAAAAAAPAVSGGSPNLNRLQSDIENNSRDSSFTKSPKQPTVNFAAAVVSPVAATTPSSSTNVYQTTPPQQQQPVPVSAESSDAQNLQAAARGFRQLTVKKAEPLKEAPMSVNPDDLNDEDYEEDEELSDDDDSSRGGGGYGRKKNRGKQQKNRQPQKQQQQTTTDPAAAATTGFGESTGGTFTSGFGGGFNRTCQDLSAQAGRRPPAVSSKSKLVESKGLGRGSKRQEESRAFFAKPTEFPTLAPIDAAEDPAAPMTQNGASVVVGGGGEKSSIVAAYYAANKTAAVDFPTTAPVADDAMTQNAAAASFGFPITATVVQQQQQDRTTSRNGAQGDEEPAPAATEEEREYVFDLGGLTPEGSINPEGPQAQGVSGRDRRWSTIVPDTMSVQHLLPSGKKGIGRGIHLLAEGEILRLLNSGKQKGSSVQF